MRKFVAGLVAGTMILSLTACLPTGVNNAGDKDSNEALATVTSTSNSGGDITTPVNNGNDGDNNNINNPDNPDDNGNGGDTASHSGYTSYPGYSVYDYTVENKFLNDDYSDTKIIDTSYSNIYIHSGEYADTDDYKELAEKIQQVNKDNETRLKETYEGFVSDFDDMYSDVDITWGPVFYEYDHKGVIRADQKIFSTGNDAEVYYGGAHGGNYVGGFCYDSQTGEEITFNDVFVKTDGLADIITDKLYENYDKEIFFSETREDLKEDVQMYVDQLVNDGATNWTVNYDGVGIYFGDYALAAYASGHQIVFINYDEYPDYLNPEYFENADDEYIMHVSQYVYYPMNLGDKEYGLSFSWEKYWNEQGQFYSDTYQFVNIYGPGDFYQQINIDGSFIDPSIYIIRKNGTDYLYVQNYFFDGVEYLQVFEFNGKEFEEVVAYQGGIYVETNELTETTFSANGSFAGSFAFSSTTANVDDDGWLELGEVFYYDLYDGWEEKSYYEAVSDIKAYEPDDDFKPSKDEKTLAKGTRVRPFASDLDKYIILIDTDGNFYAFNIKWDSYEMTIGGKKTFDLFDIHEEW